MFRSKSWLVAAGVVLAAATLNAAAVPRPCAGQGLPLEQRWNPPPEGTPERLQQFYQLGLALESALREGTADQIEQAARAYLKAAEEYPCNWNFGNAVHDANMALGLVALQRGQLHEARAGLRAAARTTGSPQLESFGPALDLAAALAAAGETAVVIDYLTEIRRFWEQDFGRVEHWIEQLRSGRQPDFGLNLRHRRS